MVWAVAVTDSVPIEYEITNLERLSGCGSLVAMACVAVDIGGILVELQGVQVRLVDGNYVCQAPRFKEPRSGKYLPAVILPEELSRAIGNEVVTHFEPQPTTHYPQPMKSEL